MSNLLAIGFGDWSFKKASSLLARMTEWIMTNSRMIEIVVGLGFGVMFLYKGLVVLL